MDYVTLFINPYNGISMWVFYASIIAIAFGVIYFVLMLTFTRGMRTAFNRFFKKR